MMRDVLTYRLREAERLGLRIKRLRVSRFQLELWLLELSSWEAMPSVLERCGVHWPWSHRGVRLEVRPDRH
jgi:hypothetical protein